MRQNIQIVSLKDVRCFAYHGWYPEEQLIGGWFSVNIEATFNTHLNATTLSHTINYELLNTIIRTEMKHTQKLLETVVARMLEQIKTNYPFILTAEVSITKHRPPMEGSVGASFVGLKYIAENELH